MLFYQTCESFRCKKCDAETSYTFKEFKDFIKFTDNAVCKFCSGDLEVLI